jgi:hypothetical protein
MPQGPPELYALFSSQDQLEPIFARIARTGDKESFILTDMKAGQRLGGFSQSGSEQWQDMVSGLGSLHGNKTQIRPWCDRNLKTSGLSLDPGEILRACSGIGH